MREQLLTAPDRWIGTRLTSSNVQPLLGNPIGRLDFLVDGLPALRQPQATQRQYKHPGERRQHETDAGMQTWRKTTHGGFSS